MSSLGPLAAFGASVTWAVGSGVYSKLSRDHSSFAVNFTRASVALPLFILASFALSGGWQEGWHAYQSLNLSHFGWFGLSILASYAIGDSIFLWSTRDLGLPGALAIASSYPLWTSIIGVGFRGETLSSSQVVGLFMTIAGVVTVILTGKSSNPVVTVSDGNQERPSLSRGVTLAFITSFLWAINTFAVSRGGADVLSPVGNTVRMAYALILTLLMGRIFARGRPLTIPFQSWKKLSWVFVFEGFGGSFFFVYGLAHSPLAIGSTLSSLAPVLSIPVAWFLGTETLSPMRILGVCSVVGGLSLLVGAIA
jgi:drug/metabolite transporter (DMT)-like permease